MSAETTPDERAKRAAPILVLNINENFVQVLIGLLLMEVTIYHLWCGAWGSLRRG